MTASWLKRRLNLHWRTWALLLWLPTIIVLAFAIARIARSAWVYDPICWTPSLSWLVGIFLMFVGRPRINEEYRHELLHLKVPWIIFAYAVALGLLNPMLWFPGSIDGCPAYIMISVAPFPCFCPMMIWVKISREYGMWWFALFMAPLAWVGVTNGTEIRRSICPNLLFGKWL
jgi:hypothetical protein